MLPLAFLFGADFVCNRSESLQIADCVEKLLLDRMVNR
ncbi:hypothetical protein RB2083_1192 [Rhodobacteraceae bacterium HTCC2083]|nr:hypothetical protein RB2083_1192 [Rhodobacteraceae bacterium HTCC2083]